MQIDLEDVLALGDSMDRVLADYPAGVASLQALNNAGALRVETEQQLAELGVRYLYNPISNGCVDLRAQALLAERCGRHLYHGASLFQDVVGGYVVSQLAHLPTVLSEQMAAGGFSVTAPLGNDPMGNVVQARITNGAWMLDGTLPMVPYAAESTHVLVETRDDDGTQRYFLLPMQTEGVLAQHSYAVDGTAISALQLRRVQLPQGAMVGADEVGEAVTQGQRHASLLLCFEAVGLMEQLMRKTTEYLKIRKQFGQAIGTFQALQHRMVDVLLMLEQTRSAAQLALNAMTSGAEDQNVRLSAAKYAVGVYGQQVAQECIQLHGGIGMTWELDVSHYAKRLLMLDHYFDNADQSLSQVMAAI